MELIAICIVFITHTSSYNCIWIKAGLLYMLVLKTWDHHASGYESSYNNEQRHVISNNVAF